MCGDSSRTSVGGTIAILKAFDNLPDISLLFHTSPTSTTATFQSPTNSPSTRDFSDYQIVIHRDGDLRAETTPQSVLHSLPLSASQRQSRRDKQGFEAFSLPKRLELGVGDEGVVGRRVSLVRDTPMGATVLRQGIIGWN